MQNSYTYKNQFTQHQFNADATDEEIMQIANAAEEFGYKPEQSVLNYLAVFSSSFEYKGVLNLATKIHLN